MEMTDSQFAQFTGLPTNDSKFQIQTFSPTPNKGNILVKRVARTRLRLIIVIIIVLLVILVAVLVPCLASLAEDETKSHKRPLRIGAFNVKQFGKSLMSNEMTVSVVVDIFQRYDLILVQEVRDSRHDALKELNRRLSSTGHAWTYISSKPLGRSKYYEEQYAFFYKLLSVRYMGTYQTLDTENDVYEREPFAVDFEYDSAASSAAQRVVFLALHTKPKSTPSELQQLPVTIREVARMSPTANGIIAMGDFNADCRYLSSKVRNRLELFNHPNFTSLIPDDADTTVSPKTDCAYDRIFVFNRKGSLDVRQAAIYNFTDSFNLNASMAAKISDHYPVEFLLY